MYGLHFSLPQRDSQPNMANNLRDVVPESKVILFCYLDYLDSVVWMRYETEQKVFICIRKIQIMMHFDYMQNSVESTFKAYE